ncbi:hypothetical protein ACJX0J_019704, partial [Zea mays]
VLKLLGITWIWNIVITNDDVVCQLLDFSNSDANMDLFYTTFEYNMNLLYLALQGLILDQTHLLFNQSVHAMDLHYFFSTKMTYIFWTKEIAIYVIAVRHYMNN